MIGLILLAMLGVDYDALANAPTEREVAAAAGETARYDCMCDCGCEACKACIHRANRATSKKGSEGSRLKSYAEAYREAARDRSSVIVLCNVKSSAVIAKALAGCADAIVCTAAPDDGFKDGVHELVWCDDRLCYKPATAVEVSPPAVPSYYSPVYSGGACANGSCGASSASFSVLGGCANGRCRR